MLAERSEDAVGITKGQDGDARLSLGRECGAITNGIAALDRSNLQYGRFKPYNLRHRIVLSGAGVTAVKPGFQSVMLPLRSGSWLDFANVMGVSLPI